MPFGSAHDELGFVPGNESVPVSPRSFALDCGSAPLVWITDNAKNRIVQFVALSPSELLGSIHVREGFRLRDLALRGCGDLWAILDETEGAIAPIGRLGPGRRLLLTDGANRLYALALFGSQGSLEVSSPGSITQDQPELAGIWRVDAETGIVAAEPGLFVPPVSARDPTWIGVESHDGRTWTVTWSDAAGPLATRELRIRLIGGDGERIPVVAGILPQTRTTTGIAAFVQVSSNRGGRGGDWYLEIPADPRGRIVFERLPEGGAYSDQARHLAFGGDGRLYVMVTDPDGIWILAH